MHSSAATSRIRAMVDGPRSIVDGMLTYGSSGKARRADADLPGPNGRGRMGASCRGGPCEGQSTARLVLTNRTIIGAFTAQSAVLRAADPTPHRPQRLPKHVRCRCATPRRIRARETHVLASDVVKRSLHRSNPMNPSPPDRRAGCGPDRLVLRARPAVPLDQGNQRGQCCRIPLGICCTCPRSCAEASTCVRRPTRLQPREPTALPCQTTIEGPIGGALDSDIENRQGDGPRVQVSRCATGSRHS